MSVTIDVPGKAILFGEHFVVYGARALALGVNPGVSVTWERASAGHELHIPQWDLALRADNEGNELQQAFAALLDALGFDVPPLRIAAAMHLPSGSGLGSSASLGIATLIACEEAAGVFLSREERVAAGFSWERVFHGNPSGFDHATAIYGGLVSYQRHAQPALTPHHCTTTLQLVIAQVQPGASTRRMVEGVATWREANADTFAALLREADQRFERALQAIERANLSVLGQLMDDNHRALQQIGVSTPALDVAVQRAREVGALGAKLTGAGGGGCMIALVNEESATQVAAALQPLALRVIHARHEGARTP